MVPAPLQTLTLLGYAGFGGGSVARHLPRTVVRGEYHLVAMRAQVAADVFDNAVRYVAENQQGRLFGIVEDEAQVVLGSAGGFDQPYKFGAARPIRRDRKVRRIIRQRVLRFLVSFLSLEPRLPRVAEARFGELTWVPVIWTIPICLLERLLQLRVALAVEELCLRLDPLHKVLQSLRAALVKTPRRPDNFVKTSGQPEMVAFR